MHYTNLKEGLLDFILGNTKFFFIGKDPNESEVTLNQTLELSRTIFNLDIVLIPHNVQTFFFHQIEKYNPNKIYIFNYDESSFRNWYLMASYAKKYPTVKFLIKYNLPKLNYYLLNNLDLYTTISNNSSYYSKDEVVIFKSFGEFLNNLPNKFKRVKLQSIFHQFEKHFPKKVNRTYFEHYYSFICLNLHDLYYWHTYLKHNFYEEDTTFFESHAFIRKETDKAYKVSVVKQDNYQIDFDYLSSIYFNKKDLSANNIKKLFTSDFSDYKYCIPSYLNNIDYQYNSLTNNIISIRQLKIFYETYPKYFSQLVHTLCHLKQYALFLVD